MTEGNGTQRTIGEHDARIDNLEKSVSSLHTKMDQVLANQNQDRGMRRTFALLGTIGGGIAGLVISYLGLGK